MRRLENLRATSLVASFEIVGLARVGMGLFLVVFALTYHPAPDHPQPGWVTPLVLALGVADIPAGLVQWTRRFRSSIPFAHLAFTLDLLIVGAMLVAYAFDPHRFVFALVFPVVVEGAVVLGIAGSLTAGASLSILYGVIELASVMEPNGSIPAVALRGAATIGVAVMAGSMAQVVHRERAALKKSEARFRAATDHSTDGVVLLSPEGEITFLTSSTAELLGREAGDALGESVLEFIHPEDLHVVTESFSRVLSAPGASDASEIRALHSDGSWRWLENRARNLLDDPEIGAIVVHTRDVTARKELEAELAQRLEDIRQAGEERRRLLARIVRAQEEERAWVAEALHDDPIQKLTAALMRVELVRESGLEERERKALDLVASTLSTSIETLRRLMVELRSVPLERLGLAPALREHFDRLSIGTTRLTIVDAMDEELEQPIRLVAYRIAQEAIANALKHAEAKELTVTLASRESGLWVEARDDGRGFDPATPGEPGHVGLTSMRERAQLAGGWCQISTTPDEGTAVSFWLPSGVASSGSPH